MFYLSLSYFSIHSHIFYFPQFHRNGQLNLSNTWDPSQSYNTKFIANNHQPAEFATTKEKSLAACALIEVLNIIVYIIFCRN